MAETEPNERKVHPERKLFGEVDVIVRQVLSEMDPNIEMAPTRNKTLQDGRHLPRVTIINRKEVQNKD